MYAAGIVVNDDNGYAGWKDLHLFFDYEEAEDYCLKNLSVHTFRDENNRIVNPAYMEWIRNPLRDRNNQPPASINNPNPNPYTRVTVRNHLAIVKLDADIIPDPITVDEDWEETNNSLFKFEELTFEFYDNPQKEE